MLPKMFIKALLTLATTLTVLVSSSSGLSTCGDWYNKTLATGKKIQARAVLIKREPIKDRGRIKGKASPIQTAFLLPGLGACGKKYQNEDKGACLWNGENMKSPRPKGLSPGWLTGANTKNCHRELFINRKDVRAELRVVNGCSLADQKPLTIEEGCSTIYVTRLTFIELGGDPAAGRMQIDDWDFKEATRYPPA
ncbi:hypothetical protein PtB15_2B531 [Puccinia triticina]|nr:hypothetical protein PtB15_2B531 [Puccinia triticina]